MSLEMTMLLFTTILGLVQLGASAHLATAQRGAKWNVSNRDQKVVALTGMAGRVDRAFKNLMETYAFFAVAVLVVQVTQKNSWLTALGAQVYFYARVVYFPIYAAGIPYVRTGLWLVSLAGLATILVAALKVL